MKQNCSAVYFLIILEITMSFFSLHLNGVEKTWLNRTEGDYIIHQFLFDNGEVLPELRLHYQTLGIPQRDNEGSITNAVLMLHGTMGSGNEFLKPSISDKVFAPGAPLDLTRYYIILPDAIGAGGSSKPSDGMRGKFPHYRYLDMVRAQHQLITEKLGVKHLRIVIGTSMGGMHTWMWGEAYPDMMDALMPIACLPLAIHGRNLIFRRIIVDAIKNDPEWQGGNYTKQPHGWTSIFPVVLMVTNSPLHLDQVAPNLEKAEAYVDKARNEAAHDKDSDANDSLYAWEASLDYNPKPLLKNIRARLFAVNFADDFLNPNSMDILKETMSQVKNGNYIVIPASSQTRGHDSLQLGEFWAPYVQKLLEAKEGSGYSD
jgi:homoserine O-acetyltransferase